MKRPCSYSACGFRRMHHEMHETPRGTQMVEVPDDFPQNKNVFCSFSCAMLAGEYDIRTGWKQSPEK